MTKICFCPDLPNQHWPSGRWGSSMKYEEWKGKEKEECWRENCCRSSHSTMTSTPSIVHPLPLIHWVHGKPRHPVAAFSHPCTAWRSRWDITEDGIHIEKPTCHHRFQHPIFLRVPLFHRLLVARSIPAIFLPLTRLAFTCVKIVRTSVVPSFNSILGRS